MAQEPDDLVPRLLREIRGDISVLRERSEEHSEQFKALRKEIRDWQETTATATGFSMHANIRNTALEVEIADLKKRVEKLEKVK